MSEIFILKAFTRLIKSSTDSIEKDLTVIKKFYKASRREQLMLLTDNIHDESWQSSFNRLSTFFPTPAQWNKYWKYRDRYSKDYDPKALNELITHFPFFNKYYDEYDPKKQYVEQVKALIEFQRYKVDIVRLIDSNNEDQIVDDSKSTLKKIDELADEYLRYPHVKYHKDEVTYILKFSNEHKNHSNISNLIKLLQESENCPDSIKDKKQFDSSNKHAKRQRKVIKFFDNRTCNVRK